MSESQQQQHQQQYLQQQHPPQQPLSPVQPANVYTPPAHSPEAIQTIPQGQASHQVLPPSYDQAKLPPRGVAAQRLPATMVPLNMLSDRPEPIDCPYCHRRTMTEVRKEGSSMQILVGVLLCLICPCLACVPCCAHWFEDAEYRCNQCNNMVARRRHDGPLEVSAPPVAVYSQYGQQPQMHAQPQQYEMHPQQPQLQQQQQQQYNHQQQQQQQQHQHAQPGTPQPQQKQ